MVRSLVSTVVRNIKEARFSSKIVQKQIFVHDDVLTQNFVMCEIISSLSSTLVRKIGLSMYSFNSLVET